MDHLPPELLVAIFTFLDIGQLFEVRRVCPRWQAIVDECPSVWTGRRRITERDLGPYSSLETQVNRLIYLFDRLAIIEYYFFPVFVGRSRQISWHNDGFTTETEECLRRLFGVLKQLFRAGRIPVHVNAVTFMENMIDKDGYPKTGPINPRYWAVELSELSRLESHCLFSTCSSIIVPIWTAHDVHASSYPRGVERLLGQMAANLKEIVIENLSTLTFPAGNETQPRMDAGRAMYAPSTIRVLQVTGRGRAILLSVSARLGRGRDVFTVDECTRFLHQCAEEHADVSFEVVLRQLQLDGRVQDCQVDYQDSAKLDYLLNCLRSKRVDDVQDGAALQRVACSTINSLTVSVYLSSGQPPSSTLDFLRADPLRGVTQLVVELTRRQADHPSNFDAHLRHAWNSVLQQDILTRLEFLRVRFDALPYSRVLTAPATTLALPLLESLELREAGSMAHVCSLLNAAPNLRRLRLQMRGLDATRTEEEHVDFRNQLLSAISQLTGLVSLGIELDEPDNSKGKWLDTWTTYVQCTQTGIWHYAHLREPIFDALSKLVNLDMLSVDFRTGGRYVRYVPASLQQDIRRLTSMLPRLRVVVLCSNLLEERDATSC